MAIKCNDRNGGGKITIFVLATRTSSPTSKSGATRFPPFGDGFLYIETSSKNYGNNVFVRWERTDIIQISYITFSYNRVSILTINSPKVMGRSRIQLLLEDNTWSTWYNIPKKDRYSDLTTDRTLVNLNFTLENYGIMFVYDEIDTAHADMCFNNKTITHSVY